MAFHRKAGKKRKRRRMSQAEKDKFKARMAKGRAAAKKRKPRKAAKAAKKRKTTKKRRRKSAGSISHETLLKAMAAYSGEGRHSEPVYKYKKAGKTRRRKPSNIVLSENPIHFPKTRRGRPSRIRYWLLDVYKGRHIKTYIGRSDKTTAMRDAQKKMVRVGADRVALSGPYIKRPHLDTVRK